MDDAGRDVREALKIEPANRTAQELNRAIEARTGQKQ
jgi:hypothetical protein